MIDALLFVCVVGALLVSLGVSAAALWGVISRRWR